VRRIIFICVTAVLISLSGVGQTGSWASPFNQAGGNSAQADLGRYWAGHKAVLSGETDGDDRECNLTIEYSNDGSTYSAFVEIDSRSAYPGGKCSGKVGKFGNLERKECTPGTWRRRDIVGTVLMPTYDNVEMSSSGGCKWRDKILFAAKETARVNRPAQPAIPSNSRSNKVAAGISKPTQPNSRFWAGRKASPEGDNGFSAVVTYSKDGTRYDLTLDYNDRDDCKISGAIDEKGNLERKLCDIGAWGRHIIGNVSKITVDDSETGGNWGGDEMVDPAMVQLRQEYSIKQSKYERDLKAYNRQVAALAREAREKKQKELEEKRAREEAEKAAMAAARPAKRAQEQLEEERKKLEAMRRALEEERNKDQLGSGYGGLSQGKRKTIQTRLAERGFYKSKIDGQYGAGTKAAIERWAESTNAPPLNNKKNVQALLTKIISLPAGSPEELKRLAEKKAREKAEAERKRRELAKLLDLSKPSNAKLYLDDVREFVALNPKVLDPFLLARSFSPALQEIQNRTFNKAGSSFLKLVAFTLRSAPFREYREGQSVKRLEVEKAKRTAIAKVIVGYIERLKARIAANPLAADTFQLSQVIQKYQTVPKGVDAASLEKLRVSLVKELNALGFALAEEGGAAPGSGIKKVKKAAAKIKAESLGKDPEAAERANIDVERVTKGATEKDAGARAAAERHRKEAERQQRAAEAKAEAERNKKKAERFKDEQFVKDRRKASEW